MNIVAIIASAKQQFQMSIARSMFRFCVFFSPIVNGLILGMMYFNRSPEDFTTFAVFGSSLSSFWGTILFSSVSDIDRERFMGTLESIFIAPAGFLNILIGKILGNTFWGIITMLINISFVRLFFGRVILVEDPILLLLTLLIMTISMVAMALMLAGAFTLSRSARLAMNSLEHPIYILSGMMFPLSMIPSFFHPLSYLLTQTWAVKLIRLGISGGSSQEKTMLLLGLTGLTIFYAITCKYIYKVIDYRARVSSTLGVY